MAKDALYKLGYKTGAFIGEQIKKHPLIAIVILVITGLFIYFYQKS